MEIGVAPRGSQRDDARPISGWQCCPPIARMVAWESAQADFVSFKPGFSTR